MLRSKAGVICVDANTPLLDGKNFLISDNPSHTFQLIVKMFLSPAVSGFTGIHPSAIIHPSAQLGQNVHIGPSVVIDQGVKIGDRTCIMAGCAIGPGTTVGTHCLFYPHVTLRENCQIGNRVILQPGCVLGSCGFGYVPITTGAILNSSN